MAPETSCRLRCSTSACPVSGTVTAVGVSAPGGPVQADLAREAPGEGSDALVWEQLSDTTQEDSTLSGAFLVFLVAATLVAAVGLLTDSPVLIVGAMALGPEFGPLAGWAVALVQGRRRQAHLSLRALVVGFPLAIAATAVAVTALDVAGLVPVEYLQGRRPLTSFVARPDAFSVVVALLAGVAGTVSLTSAKSATLVGVVISVTTVPAAANIATAAVTGHGGEALGAAVQLVVNLICIVVAAVATLLVQRLEQRRHRRGAARRGLSAGPRGAAGRGGAARSGAAPGRPDQGARPPR